MKRKVKRGGMSDEDLAEFGALHSLEYRLGELLVTCGELTISMSDSWEYTVVGTLRSRAHEGRKVLAVHGDLREAMAMAFLSANELDRPLRVVSWPMPGGRVG